MVAAAWLHKEATQQALGLFAQPPPYYVSSTVAVLALLLVVPYYCKYRTVGE